MPRSDMQHRPTVKSSTIKTRMTPTEVAGVKKAAERDGLPIATWLRSVALDAAAVTPAPSPIAATPALTDVDRRALADARTAIARTGGLANQLVREVHRGVVREAALGDAVRDLSAVCRELVGKLGGRSW
ncbi:hypothetical protein E3T26_02790 [Cryobacterium sp. TMT1-21]|uniref:plasmid mobilization protein n=1 Tax=Cryobacterium sp. TMT1-21 TaxID=1259234 RepID=UPI00106AB9DE|nr:hypothetical protein [Cryobacterium sp. TMT1-21]TFD17035.1 hypothetical protein E3T26_02790 [Cryobacterium sp. TMT1-21]